ncbi:type II secretion system protein G [Zobellella endophytica]|uniref:Type II secretion system protein G n=1 Tax=Zobellella endophytica TaxID=2116700 RepID=A0A2P7R973_9GAMM|nr:prepilin-type N-terminal cleavage/methylation domain-containing protein [Zobellella endophytica]PSJ46740.1 type II secretion system protein G [Zobellella endophytica]
MKRGKGFTLIELLVVMAIIAILLTIAGPRYFSSLEGAKETTLRQSLAVMREALDQYYGDTGRYPESIEALVEQRYLRQLPRDPLLDSSEHWVLLPPPEGAGVYDVKSGAPGLARDGSRYGDW